MAVEIHPLNVGVGVDVAAEMIRSSGDNEGGEFDLNSVGKDWTVARYKADYATFSDIQRFSAMFSGSFNTAMLDF